LQQIPGIRDRSPEPVDDEPAESAEANGQPDGEAVPEEEREAAKESLHRRRE
jgi:hypothetical protein